jgi:tetratricopeptide (TPR) repeat protein
MRGKTTIVTVAALAAFAALALLAGCNKQEPRTELDIFADQFVDMDGSAREGALRALAGGSQPEGGWAAFLLGNHYYNAAADTAAVSGWDAPSCSALLDSAETWFAAAVASDSTFIEALVNLGSVWDDRAEQRVGREERDERVRQAEQHYQAALAIDPVNEKARCNLGGLYMRLRRTSDALAEFQAVLDHNPESALAHYNLAIMFAEQKIYREAMREWELAAKYDPDGDIGERSRANVQIVVDLMNAPDPQGAAH